MRRLLLGVFVFGVVGTGAELFLLEHTEDTLQWIPLALMGVSIIAVAWCITRPSRASVRVMQGVMAAFVAAGALGLILHYRGNVAFELEMYPSMTGMKLFWEALRGATPALSPGTMVVLGLIGWIYTFRHPALIQRAHAGDVNRGAF